MAKVAAVDWARLARKVVGMLLLVVVNGNDWIRSVRMTSMGSLTRKWASVKRVVRLGPGLEARSLRRARLGPELEASWAVVVGLGPESEAGLAVVVAGVVSGVVGVVDAITSGERET